MASTNFQNFLHASLGDSAEPARRPHRLPSHSHSRQSYRGYRRTLSAMQCSELACCYDLQPHDHAAHLYPDFPGSFVQGPSDKTPVSNRDEDALIEDFSWGPGVRSPTDDMPAGPSTFMPFRPATGSFSSSSSASTSFQSTSNSMAWHSQAVQRTPNPALLTQFVDASKYEAVDDSAWMFSSVDYEASSPSSVDTSGSGPHTPVSPLPRNSLCQLSQTPLASSFHGMMPKIESIVQTDRTSMPSISEPSFPSVEICRCMACLAIRSEPPAFSSMWQAAQAASPAQFPHVHHPHAHGRYVTPPGLEHAYIVPQTGLPTLTLPAPFPATSSLQELERQAPQPMPMRDIGSGDESEVDDDVHDGPESTAPRDRDQYLLSMRARGLSYKEIKRRGRFTEAESTLRGRVRVLTKDKSERVRRPEWTNNDLILLHHAVELFTSAKVAKRGAHHGRFPWKKISGWMRDHGSSYLFAPATCAKKWKELF